jgi:hypothetical protein
MVNDGKKYCHRATNTTLFPSIQQQIEDLRGKPGITENNIVFAHACWHGLQRHGRKNRKKLKH